MQAAASISRRDLLKGKTKPHQGQASPMLRPPGVSHQSAQNCTLCGICVDACPQKILSVTGDGVAAIPGRGECNFCGTCAGVCPEPVFDASLDFHYRFEISGDCLAHNGITCMTCRDVCPKMAITMLPRIRAPFLPKLQLDICTGCGACVGSCPTGAITAVMKGGR